ncbi:MAG: DUF3293 domain-containing protein [Pseudomonadota bacterium]|nr:DUF3293 domain-containing protein [Pseudomonadota bacterium]
MKQKSARLALESAFRNAYFRVTCAGREFIRRIGQIDHAADAALKTAGCRSHWAILTPCNPDARKLSDADNAIRLATLRQQLDALKLRYLPSINSAADGSWPEPGCCVLDAAPVLTDELARQYAQLAYVGAKLGEAPALCWMPKP